MIWRKFNALGSEIIISASLESGQEEILDQAEKTVLEFDQRFSRFKVDNELQRFNDSIELEASEIMVDLLKTAKQFYQRTQGVFDPTVINSLEKVGYRQSFIESTESQENVDLVKVQTGFFQRPKMDELEIIGNQIYKPKELRIDFGGLGKGYIVDYLSEEIFSQVKDYWISAGGDLIVKGSSENDIGWKVGVQNPQQPDTELFSIQTSGERLGVATSGIFKRAGLSGSFRWHHLIDHRTGLPVENEILAVTAIAPSVVQADVFAKTVLILGRQAGLDFIEKQTDCACIIFFKQGGLVFSNQALKYLK